MSQSNNSTISFLLSARFGLNLNQLIDFAKIIKKLNLNELKKYIFRHEYEHERGQILSEHEAEMKKQEEVFSEEKSRMKEQLHEIVTNEVNLLNRIKSLEADEGYSRFVALIPSWKSRGRVWVKGPWCGKKFKGGIHPFVYYCILISLGNFWPFLWTFHASPIKKIKLWFYLFSGPSLIESFLRIAKTANWVNTCNTKSTVSKLNSSKQIRFLITLVWRHNSTF